MGRLEVKIGKLKLQNPVMAASGAFGCGEEYREFFDVNKLGAIVTKTITLNPRIGNKPPRVVETPAGMLNSIGLENGGLEEFLKNKAPFLKRLKGPKVIVSIAGEDEKEFACLARSLEKAGFVDALELNLSCPNIKRRYGKDIIAQDERAVRSIVKAVRAATGLTVIAKLSPNVTDIAETAKLAESAGADSISLVNTFSGMAVDARTQRPVLGNTTGGLSGPAIKPIALKMVWDAYRAVKVPVIGIGGIMTAQDAVEFILCGAAAVQIGTANFVDPGASLAIIKGIREYMKEMKIKTLTGITGRLKA